MRIAVATDHGGFILKKTVMGAIKSAGHDVVDYGTDSAESVDYPDFTEPLCRAIQTGEADRGVLLCGSGVGVCIAANKMKGIYAAICHDTYSAHQGVEHDHMNVLCLGGRVIGSDLADEIVQSFLKAQFVGNQTGKERHARRVGKILKLENGESLR